MSECPECGNEMGVGYSVGDICFECYDIGDAADDILRELHKYCPALAVVSKSAPEGGVRDVIKSVIRTAFFNV